MTQNTMLVQMTPRMRNIVEEVIEQVVYRSIEAKRIALEEQERRQRETSAIKDPKTVIATTVEEVFRCARQDFEAHFAAKKRLTTQYHQQQQQQKQQLQQQGKQEQAESPSIPKVAISSKSSPPIPLFAEKQQLNKDESEIVEKHVDVLFTKTVQAMRVVDSLWDTVYCGIAKDGDDAMSDIPSSTVSSPMPRVKIQHGTSRPVLAKEFVTAMLSRWEHTTALTPEVSSARIAESSDSPLFTPVHKTSITTTDPLSAREVNSLSHGLAKDMMQHILVRRNSLKQAKERRTSLGVQAEDSPTK